MSTATLVAPPLKNGDRMDRERNGVLEYIVWRVEDNAIDWFQLRNGRFERREPDANGIIESEVFPGLRLNINLMLDGDLAGVLAELDTHS